MHFDFFASGQKFQIQDPIINFLGRPKVHLISHFPSVATKTFHSQFYRKICHLDFLFFTGKHYEMTSKTNCLFSQEASPARSSSFKTFSLAFQQQFLFASNCFVIFCFLTYCEKVSDLNSAPVSSYIIQGLLLLIYCKI